ncbi:MAG: type II toxin-antitoxin system HicA family toxin [Vicinamibacteria bacterium]
MKRTELIRHLASQDCQLLREGGRHSIYWSPTNRKTSAVPRHSEILEPWRIASARIWE